MKAVLETFLPPRCLACGHAGAEPFCPECADELVPDRTVHLIDDGLVAMAGLVYSGPVAAAVKHVKTAGMRAGGRALAKLIDIPPADVVTWVPAPARRRRRRGMDLPELLAGGSAVRLLRRIGRPVEQPDLTREQRLAAQAGTFAPLSRSSALVRGRSVVLVDDVRATGATLVAAAMALRSVGAGRIIGLTLAASEGPPSAGRQPADRIVPLLDPGR